MLATQISAAQHFQVQPPASLAAGANNGAWFDVRRLIGQSILEVLVGAVTGSVTVRLQDATDITGTGAADVPGVTTATLSAANTPALVPFVPDGTRGFVRVVSTVVTGPVLVAAVIIGHNKYT
jgi:hypothetical protein